MGKSRQTPTAGFSLIELMVAVLFIGFLMAGMANVFKSSVGVVATSSEGLSSARRNRMSIDLLYDDLNSAGMFLSDLSSPPKLSPSNPAFYIIPNVTIAGAAADDPPKADQVVLYLDEPLPFEGTLTSTGGGNAGASKAMNASELVLSGAAAPSTDNTFLIDCSDASFASMVKIGCSVVFKDSWETFYVSGVTPSSKSVTITTAADPNAAMTGVGASGAPPKAKHIPGSSVMFYRPAQMVRYSVKMKLFDPVKTTGVPCLVREQDNYNATGAFNGADSPKPSSTLVESIVAENVSGFKVYLSANSGQSWAGTTVTATGFDSGWTAGIRAELDAQLTDAGRADFTTTAGNDNWIRSIPTLVRVDITTRTAVKRSEYSATPLTSTAYKDFTQSLVIVPRHFGLTMN